MVTAKERGHAFHVSRQNQKCARIGPLFCGVRNAAKECRFATIQSTPMAA